MAVRRKFGRPVMATLITLTVLTAPGCSAATTRATTTADGIALDSQSQLDVSPVDYGGKRVVTAVFGTIAPGRSTVLQAKTGSGWQDVAQGVQDAWGEVEFVADGDAKTVFRAITQATTLDGRAEPELATGEGKPGQKWSTALASDFSGSSLSTTQWKFRGTGSYTSSSRHCAAQYPSNVAVQDGKLVLSVTSEDNPANLAKAKNAGCESDLVLRNAMIGTDGLATFRSGLVAARIKFPESQGMHGSLWLQSTSTSEIDIIDSFGYGRGQTSVLQASGKRYPGTGEDTHVNLDLVEDRAWWSDYHVYSAEWTNTQVIFRVDGQITRRVDKTIPDLDYFLVISLLSADWEQKQFEQPVGDAPDAGPAELPQSMSVDWIKVWNRE